MLRTEDGFCSALQFFENQISARTSRVDRMIETLLQQDASLERFVSSELGLPWSWPVYHNAYPCRHTPEMSQQSQQSFSAYLKDQCPDDSTINFLQSLPFQILLRFESYLASCIPVPFEDLGDQVRSHSTSVTKKSAALIALEPYCELGSLETISSLSSKTFVDCGERVPKTGQEAKKLGGRLIRDLTIILRVGLGAKLSCTPFLT